MSEYKRLTNKDWKENYDIFEDVCCDTCTEDCGECERNFSALVRLAELEDKIENGTLMELPCKVGDRIWVILGNNIFGRKVKSIVIRGDGYTIKTSNTNGWKDLEPYYNAEFGVIWFLTKAEAEAKLKELQEGKK